MPRSSHPRKGRRDEEPEPLDLERILGGARHTESRRDGVWNVQPQSAAAAAKEYSCPGCGLVIAPGTPHLVAWRADGLFGEDADLADRRHWHTHCWRIRA
ncbi:hypothetical protein [Protaetiibacter larvae]|uniref:ATP/GTP-binding protein n=1 Tax=Protaetiibacter larvae TaxID=2592654 RepID=A0A5C1YBM8_9MICO|nr:hypothetical protein [Protaetiibacter larvae]QEO10539.1 hypothetical protein FLP23_11330 [Protaetiibacter larvae]